MFTKILIANRGEIACRIIKTAQRLGISTVALYSEADEKSRHVAMADQAFCIGPAPALQSYLSAEKIIATARKAKAQAIHPGYGFLAENPDFARMCQDADIVFIGPSARTIQEMGDKSLARKIMQKAGVPVTPGYNGDKQTDRSLKIAANKIGYPLLIKARAGGGGKGMRVVLHQQEFSEALAGARREALAAFGDDAVILEKYLKNPRHIEVQVFADSLGNTVHLFERDCSIQRRFQKIIEESPAPLLSKSVRQKIFAAAVQAAQAIGYQGAGTVEFLLDTDNSYYFMEMNTRLQVEHPVTEMVTGLDLVEWQLQVAAGQPLPLNQTEIHSSGHAIEVRIYAEDTLNSFLPAAGRITHLVLPNLSKDVRLDTGIEINDSVGVHYDPLIAKLITKGKTRKTAIKRLNSALHAYQILGFATNLGFLSKVVKHGEFQNGAIDTGFIERHHTDLFGHDQSIPDHVTALAVLAVTQRQSKNADSSAAQSAEPFSPWHATSGWRLNMPNSDQLTFTYKGMQHVVTFSRQEPQVQVEYNDKTSTIAGSIDPSGNCFARFNFQEISASVFMEAQEVTIISHGTKYTFSLVDPAQATEEEVHPAGTLSAPMPGEIIKILVKTGEIVSAGTPLLILEAMKMEHTITAPMDGRVKKIVFESGVQVKEGAELVVLESVLLEGTH